MNVVLLAGGKGLRLPEETIERPKPLVEIGGKPILDHILHLYSRWGHNDFIICLGYKGYMIKEYFLNYYEHNNNIFLDLKNGDKFINTDNLPWTINLIDTGEETNTGGRLLYPAQTVLKHEKTFMMTYGDGLTNVNINNIIRKHNDSKKLCTFLGVKSPSKFGSFNADATGNVTCFTEKSCDGSYINAGFFVCETEVFKYIRDDNTSWEYDVLPQLVEDKELSVYRYDGFWKSMDSLKDKLELEKLWQENRAPWKIW
jgi:glucose-1-phosphate cytidylyltransferase